MQDQVYKIWGGVGGGLPWLLALLVLLLDGFMKAEVADLGLLLTVTQHLVFSERPISERQMMA